MHSSLGDLEPVLPQSSTLPYPFDLVRKHQKVKLKNRQSMSCSSVITITSAARAVVAVTMMAGVVIGISRHGLAFVELEENILFTNKGVLRSLDHTLVHRPS